MTVGMDRTQPLLPPRVEMERAYLARDASYDGVFFVAVRTTGIFCRPSCPSRPRLENVEFLPTLRECLVAGYRACKRCRPTEVDGTPPPWAAALIERVTRGADGRVSVAELRAAGVTPERARRWFKERFGLTFSGWCRAHRLASAFTRIRAGAGLDDAGLEAGFDSQSGFRRAFEQTFGLPPGRSRTGAVQVVVAWIESPVGPLLAGVGDGGVCLLEYTHCRMVEETLASVQKIVGAAVVPGEHPLLDRLRQELTEYFAGERRVFTLPLAVNGTSFQTTVWRELQRIPHGQTISYAALAERVGSPTAQRAVARANGQNRISVLIPCHRVIGQDGELTGYGGGLWRKRLLLELERTGRLPG